MGHYFIAQMDKIRNDMTVIKQLRNEVGGNQHEEIQIKMISTIFFYE